MTDFWQSQTYRIVEAMKATGNSPGIVEQWRSAAEAWAIVNGGTPEADALKAWLPLWQVRPFYTAEELAPMMPALAVLLGFADRAGPVKSANRLANELGFSRLPFRIVEGRKYFLVEQIHIWRDAPLSALVEILR